MDAEEQKKNTHIDTSLAKVVCCKFMMYLRKKQRQQSNPLNGSDN